MKKSNWLAAFSGWGTPARASRSATHAAKQGYAVSIAHVSFPGIGHVHANGKGYTWTPVNYSIPQ